MTMTLSVAPSYERRLNEYEKEAMLRLVKKRKELEVNLKNEKVERERMEEKLKRVKKAHIVDLSNVKNRVRVSMGDLFERKLTAMQEAFHKESNHYYLQFNDQRIVSYRVCFVLTIGSIYFLLLDEHEEGHHD